MYWNRVLAERELSAWRASSLGGSTGGSARPATNPRSPAAPVLVAAPHVSARGHGYGSGSGGWHATTHATTHAVTSSRGNHGAPSGHHYGTVGARAHALKHASAVLPVAVTCRKMDFMVGRG